MSEGVSESVGVASGCLRVTFVVVDHFFVVVFGRGPHDKPKP